MPFLWNCYFSERKWPYFDTTGLPEAKSLGICSFFRDLAFGHGPRPWGGPRTLKIEALDPERRNQKGTRGPHYNPPKGRAAWPAGRSAPPAWLAGRPTIAFVWFTGRPGWPGWLALAAPNGQKSKMSKCQKWPLQRPFLTLCHFGFLKSFQRKNR